MPCIMNYAVWRKRIVRRTGILLALGTLLGGPATPAAEIREGQPFPEIRLPAMRDGRPLSVADFRGSKLVLHVFASW